MFSWGFCFLCLLASFFFLFAFVFFFKSPCFLLRCLTGSVKWRKNLYKTPCITHRSAIANCPDLTVPLEVTQGEKEDKRVWICSCSRPLGTAEKQTRTVSSSVSVALSCVVERFCLFGFVCDFFVPVSSAIASVFIQLRKMLVVSWQVII